MNLLKPIPDSLDPDEAFRKSGFFISLGRYYTYNFKGDNKTEVELSNFTGESIVHLINGTNNSRRIIKIQRHTGEIEIVEVQSSELKPDSFETILKSKRCTFLGTAYQLKRIFAEWMDRETQAIIIETMGWNHEQMVYAFANAVFTAKGKILKVNDVGIVEDPDDNARYYLPAFGLANKNNTDYEGERKFAYIDGAITFDKFAQLYFDAFESNGGIALLFLILSVFWDIVFDQLGSFPFLFLFGAYGTGKTSLVEYLLRVFGKDFKGIPLNNATQVALSRTIASRNNSIFYLKEYTKETDESNQDLFLTAYDGSGRATGVKSNDNRTKVAMVKSSIILDGNELPTQKTAVLSRMILLNFEKNQFSPDQRKAFAELEKIQDEGFGKVICEILQHRNYFEKNFKRVFDDNLKEVRETVAADFADRTIKHIALLLVPAKMLYKKLNFPFSFDDITKAVFQNAIEQNRLLKQTDEITIFWTAFSWGVKNGNLIRFNREQYSDNKKLAHYNLKFKEGTGDPILQIKLPGIFPEYVKYCKNNGQRFLDNNSLKMLLTSGSYKPFVANEQKKRGDAYTDFYFGSCYQFHLDYFDSIYSINEIELNL